MSNCKFGRQLSFSGNPVCLYLNLRNRLTKDKLLVEDLGKVKIYNRDPRKCLSAQVVAELDPQILSPGKLFAIWDIPSDQKECVFYDSWEDILLKDYGITKTIVQKFYVSDDLCSMEECLQQEYKIKMTPERMYVDSREYVVFELLEPKSMIFPCSEIRIIAATTAQVTTTLNQRFQGPGLNPVFQSNARFPVEPIIIFEASVQAKSQFVPLTTFENKAYALFDTAGVTPGLYKFQLKLITGEVEKVTRPFGLTIRESDFTEGISIKGLRSIL